MTKFLIIRFSSIGDIIQCMGIIGGIRERFADVEIHWITRKDMVGTTKSIHSTFQLTIQIPGISSINNIL